MNIQEFDFSVNLLRALLWQYNDARNLQSLLQSKQDWYSSNQEEFWINWYRDVFDVRTANNFGLTIWSIILDIPIIVVPQEPEEDIPFGFDETDGNFEHSNFRRELGAVQVLSTEQARTVILMRYHQLTTDGSVIYTNSFYKDFFDGSIYVVDNLDMTITYVINFTPAARIRYILENYDILPRPAGVLLADINVVPGIPFGFDEFNNNFDQGNFKD
jgi:hypothetical protein